MRMWLGSLSVGALLASVVQAQVAFELRDDEVVPNLVFDHRVATGDLDGDGDVDAVIGDWGDAAGGEFATLVRNDTPRCGAWTEVVLRSAAGAPNPPGARVTLVSRRGRGPERRQTREASAQTNFRTQGGSPFLFGVPPGERILRAEIRWPDGRTGVLAAPPRNGRRVVRDRRG